MPNEAKLVSGVRAGEDGAARNHLVQNAADTPGSVVSDR
jgi:hypothetical protein